MNLYELRDAYDKGGDALHEMVAGMSYAAVNSCLMSLSSVQLDHRDDRIWDVLVQFKLEMEESEGNM